MLAHSVGVIDAREQDEERDDEIKKMARARGRAADEITEESQAADFSDGGWGVNNEPYFYPFAMVIAIYKVIK